MSEDAGELKKAISPEASRALAEAEARRARNDPSAPKKAEDEKGGPKGAEPTRFGDWERDGRAYDF